MIKKILSIVVLISGISVSGAIISFANAQTTTVPAAQTQPQLPSQASANIQFPVKELGNCGSKEACKVFCDDSKNSDACLAFAEKHKLMSSDEVSAAKKFVESGMVGPGGCNGQVACEEYCGNSTHLEECMTFTQKNGMMSDQQLQDSKKVLVAIKNGLKPPACGGPQQCNTYCSSPDHMEECMTFSLAAGIVPEGQKAQMEKTLDAIKKGAKPPACQPTPPDQSGQQGQPGQSKQSKQAGQSGLPTCDQYCNSSDHMEECMTFSLAAGMVPDNQKAQMQKTLDAFKQGIKPPACQPNQPNQSGQPNQPGQSGGVGGSNEGQGFNPGSDQNGNGLDFNQGGAKSQPNQSGQGLQACDQYCADSSHVEECVKFSVAVGNMTEQQAQTAIKTGGKGPGGCIGKDACDTFCNNPNNQETCFNFAKDNGMISQDQLQQMQAGQQKMKDSFSSIPQAVLGCISSSLGADVVEKMKTGSVTQRKDGDAINQCFQKFGVQERRPGQNQSGQDQQNQQSQNGQPGQGSLNNMSEDLKNCLQSQVGVDGLTKIQSRPLNDPALMEKARSCFEKYGQQNQRVQQDQSGQSNQQIQPWADMCSNNTELACADDAGKFVVSAKVGSDGKPVCPAGSTAKCGNYQQQNQQGQNQQTRAGENFQPGSGAVNPGGQQMPQQAGPGGCKGPEECSVFCQKNPEICKNFRPQQGQSGGLNQAPQPGQQSNQPNQQGGQPGQSNNQSGQQPNQPGQMQPQQQLQPQFNQGQPGQFNPTNQPNQPGDQQPTNQPGQPMNQASQSGQIQPQQQLQPQVQQQPPVPPQNIPSSSSGFLDGAQKFLANILDAFK